MTSNHPFTKERVNRYIEAETLSPNARVQEFESILNHLDQHFHGKGTVLELGSGAGLLTRKLLDHGYQVATLDAAFEKNVGVKQHLKCDLSQGIPKDFQGNDYVAVVSLAAMHHIIADPARLPDILAAAIYSRIKSNGLLIIQDVPARTAVKRRPNGISAKAAHATALFFEEIVDGFSQPPHNAVYAQMDLIAQNLEQDFSWRLLHNDFHHCPWEFSESQDVTEFVRTLFNLSIDHDALAHHIENMIYTEGDSVFFNWALDLLVMEKSGPVSIK
jgi:2-polyprenyl-3-methyl-5-hydroxy-6-metoxy-1,4-benzoquinol methylase